jgi:hypothetical protein
VALPITEEASGDIQVVNVAPRLTPHVRHREKYVDVPVAEHREFVFQANGRPSERRARTLRQFVSIVERLPAIRLEGSLRRGDFSRWISVVFGDYPLAAELRALEQRHRAAASPETVAEIAAAIRGRYDLARDDLLPAAN